jgi:peptidoglycan/LPS O-acetylase OafA/YrhL
MTRPTVTALRAQAGLNRHRFDQLDSLRGLAAITVVAHHYLMTQPAIANPDQSASLPWLKYTPLHVFWAGNEAVLLFFVLSGFVLSLPFLEGSVSYVPFIIRRIFRIGLPYWCAVSAAIVVRALTYRGNIPALSTWFNLPWSQPLSFQLIIQHALLVDSFPNGTLVPVIWSLVYEMRISIVFPLLMYAVSRWNWKTCLLGAYAVGGLGTVATVLSARVLHSQQDYTQTLEYVPMFIVGAILAKNRDAIVSWSKGLSAATRGGILLLALLAYTYHWLTFSAGPVLHLWDFLDNSMVTIGSSVAVVAALSSSIFNRFLSLRAVHSIGQASYSLYLFHTIILLGAIHLLFSTMALVPILIACALITTVLALVLYETVERNSILLGRRIAQRAGPRLPRAVVATQS